jgi:hypothetical protein
LKSPIWVPEWTSDNALAQVHELLIRCYYLQYTQLSTFNNILEEFINNLKLKPQISNSYLKLRLTLIVKILNLNKLLLKNFPLGVVFLQITMKNLL